MTRFRDTVSKIGVGHTRRGDSGNVPVRVALFLAVPVLAGLFSYLIFVAYFLTPVDPGGRDVTLFEVPRDARFREVAADLEKRGLVEHGWAVSLLGRITGADRRVMAGEYELSASMTPVEVLRKLGSGKPFERRVTVKEGMTIAEVADAVDASGILKKDEFVPALTDRRLLESFGIPGDSFEGYLFPETYVFSRPVTAERIITKMVGEGESRWTPSFTERADQLGFSRSEILTLASVIEKESGNVREQPLVSSVFHNRLSQGMRLQSDPTVIYGIQNFNGDLTKADLERPSRYNTYLNHGLPPGPIANPGESAVKAALYPQDSTYLYFVGDGQGSHVFSTTLAEHNQAVARYQLRGGSPAPVKPEAPAKPR